MRGGSRFVLPDFLNLGVAPPTPRGALAFAPRAKLCPPFQFPGEPFPRVPRPTNALVWGIYTLPLAGQFAGFPFVTGQTNALIPNPYEAP
jgi:hypothetical protein